MKLGVSILSLWLKHPTEECSQPEVFFVTFTEVTKGLLCPKWEILSCLSHILLVKPVPELPWVSNLAQSSPGIVGLVFSCSYNELDLLSSGSDKGRNHEGFLQVFGYSMLQRTCVGFSSEMLFHPRLQATSQLLGHMWIAVGFTHGGEEPGGRTKSSKKFEVSENLRSSSRGPEEWRLLSLI